ncbi:hypothetical protein [Shewanella marisflavi]|uniref:Uncharacterized protein n=1 Tax=Shewanella marisflavi TaxID=260364 RepID=A0AAC9XN95_9GAMM|nr:hypothetical protein [Shewanella marisflavi]ASJ96414.1 hypothetical protein CFF01_07325 [Shewanella marisflavi]MCL1043447.1 hypothetical protein [Shewanella marisflavi]
MNTLIEFEAQRLVDLFTQGDALSIHMFMDSMSMPFDVQEKLFNEISALKNLDQQQIAQVIESHGHSLIQELNRY